MRRQLGAGTVDLDTQAGLARYALHAPRRIDFGAIEEAALDASYTLSELTLELEAEASRERCEVCAAEVVMLRIPETGQRLEATGDAPLGKRIHLHAAVSGWRGPHPRLTVLDWSEAGSGHP